MVRVPLDESHPDLVALWDSTLNTKKISEVSKGSEYYAWWICPKGCPSYPAKVYNKTHGKGCPYCSGQKVLAGFNDFETLQPELAKQWRHDLNSKSPSEITEHSGYLAWWSCGLGHPAFKASPNSRLNDYGCPYCSGRKSLRGSTDLSTLRPDLAAQWHPELNKIGASEVTVSSSKKAWWVCPEDDSHVWYSHIYARSYGNGCPECWKSLSTSVGENEVYSFVKSLKDDTIQSDWDALGSLQLDVYVPSTKIGIEYNGLYWHSDALSKDKMRHKKKYLLAESKGIQLITVWEDEWKNRRGIVERMLKHKLGVSDARRVFARKTDIDPVVSKEEASVFMSANHLQGYSRSSLRVGLRDVSGTLVALSLFTKYGGELRLERYATSAHVLGGQGKILKWVDRNIEYSIMSTFADHMISDGSLYEQTGWQADKELDPDYCYLYNNRRYHKFNYRKKRFKDDETLLFEDGLSESQLAELNNLRRIWDAGKTKYIRRKKDV